MSDNVTSLDAYRAQLRHGIDWEKVAAQLNTSAERAAEAMQALGLALDVSPKAELLWRLNSWARGEYPGEPVNWPGERGMRA